MGCVRDSNAAVERVASDAAKLPGSQLLTLNSQPFKNKTAAPA